MLIQSKSANMVRWSLVSCFLLSSSCIAKFPESSDSKTDENISSPPSKTPTTLRQARWQAKYRQRRIIMNNDGNDFEMIEPENLQHPEKFLERRTTPLINSQVDSIFYCTGVFNMYSNLMAQSEPRNSKWFKPDMMAAMKERNIDPLKMMIEFCRQHNKEIFWSMRMNDTHDSSVPECFAQWKKDHPDYLVGTREDRSRMNYGARRWSSLDYNLPPVRDKVFQILAEVCHRYDVDGIELDFFRHPVMFKEQMFGEKITQAQCDMVTELIRRIRQMTEREGLRRSKPILIAVRVPDSVDYCKAMGLDLERWLQDGLIDIVTGGGYFKLEPWENLVALGKQYDVPVYACFVRRRIEDVRSGPEDKSDLNIWRGEAYQAWKAGVNGIYTFNRFDPNDKIFHEIGDPKLLESLERTDQTVYVNKKLWSRPESWLKDGDKYVKEN
ncbi:MAG: family 10 glycosylhydrolase [Sedimentisphaerales bacterium]|nr:family 10 glycosylhydrolase [Sedimentisphaerales bacterium]